MQKISYCKRVTEPSSMFRKKIVFLSVFVNGIIAFVFISSLLTNIYNMLTQFLLFSLGFVMVGRSFLLIDIEKGQSIFSAALVK
jgi:hypothetical protein